MPSSKPIRCGVSFIINSVLDRRDTWSKTFRCNVNAEEAYRQLIASSPGLQQRIVITKYENGQPVASYYPEETCEERRTVQK